MAEAMPVKNPLRVLSPKIQARPGRKKEVIDAIDALYLKFVFRYWELDNPDGGGRAKLRKELFHELHNRSFLSSLRRKQGHERIQIHFTNKNVKQKMLNGIWI